MGLKCTFTCTVLSVGGVWSVECGVVGKER